MTKVYELDTPALLVRKDVLEKNIKDMAEFVANSGVKLRPHIKAHKIPEIAKMQICNGAIGVTVAKLGEAEVMIDAGIKDILIAYQIIGTNKLTRLMELMDKANISVAVDSIEGALKLSQICGKYKKKIKVLIEVDTGLRRCGVLPGKDTLNLAKKIRDLPNLIFSGIMTHAGHVYGASDYEEVYSIGKLEGEVMVDTGNLLRKNGIEVEVISVGSTPTAKISGNIKGVTEIRPGNYVFYDAIQVGLGVCKLEDCSLSVLTTVISRPTPDRIVIDAGSKTLALDKGAHGKDTVKGFGIVKEYPEVIIERLSEEHGILQVSPQCPLKIGDRIEIIPNHACTVVNLFDRMYVIQDDEVSGIFEIKARGKIN